MKNIFPPRPEGEGLGTRLGLQSSNDKIIIVQMSNNFQDGKDSFFNQQI